MEILKSDIMLKILLEIKDEMTITELAEKVEGTYAYIQRMTGHLRDEGFLLKTRSGRNQILFLTENGQEMKKKAKKIIKILEEN